MISQFTVARKGLEAETKARSLRRNLENLVEMNTARRENLRYRQTILDQYVKTDVESQPGQLEYKALKETIKKEEEHIPALTKAITKSEVAITETRTALANVEQEQAVTGWALAAYSVIIGGGTALIFGFTGYLGLVPRGSVGSIIFQNVPLTTNVVVQSLALGVGWPLVWEKFFATDKLESAASAAAATFESTIKDAEKDEV